MIVEEKGRTHEDRQRELVVAKLASLGLTATAVGDYVEIYDIDAVVLLLERVPCH